MKVPANLAVALIVIGLVIILIGFLSQIDYATAGTQEAHLRAMKIVNVGFLFVIAASWFAGRAFADTKNRSILVLVIALVSSAFFFAVLL